MQTWAEWNSRFNREIDTLTGAADNFTVFPSLFSPSNALEEGAWKPFKLSEQEVKVLLNDAPAELRARFSADNVAPSVASLTFEFSSAAILRPWFVSEALRARFWRFADPSKIISDGGRPPKGACPAYVTAIVFARKVAVEEKRVETAPEAKPFDGFRFTVAVKDQERLARISPEALAATQPRPVVTSPAMNVRAAEAVSPRTATMRVANLQAMRAADTNVAMAGPVAAPAVTARPMRLSTVAVTRLPQQSVPVTAPTAPSPSPTPSPQRATSDDAIYILAFICKALPKSPDPDLTLQW